MSLSSSQIKSVIRRNLRWFEKSGVMVPANGQWGVAERIALVNGNEALERMKNAFPAFTERPGSVVIEQRRADCNFEAAAFFLEAARVLKSAKWRRIAENVLDFLYFRSGLLNRGKDAYQNGSWNWSHIKRESVVWFDDESWCVYLQFQIARRYPELDAKYGMSYWADILADELYKAMLAVQEARRQPDNPYWSVNCWCGRPRQPHFGGLACMALSLASSVTGKDYSAAITPYLDYLLEEAEAFNTSEQSYALMGCCAAARYLNYSLDYPRRFARLIMARQGENGAIPAEHDEAPVGPNLLDLIYTINWAFVGLREYAALDSEALPACRKIMELLAGIQDKSQDPATCGCWRGMFDTATNQWGGGDKYEGGANSIYTGWTNAPIALTFASLVE